MMIITKAVILTGRMIHMILPKLDDRIGSAFA